MLFWFFTDSTDVLEDKILKNDLPRFQVWLEIEKRRQDAHCLAWKPDESKGEQDDDCEDPDRLVMFDDVSASLFKLTKSENCVKIICLLLKFLGLNSLCLNRVLSDMAYSVCSQQTFDKLHQVPYASSVFQGLDIGLKWHPHICLITFIRLVLEQAEAYFSMSNRTLFTLLRLEFEYKKTGVIYSHELSNANSKEIKKFGKNLLKESQNRNNLVVWNSFIHLSWAVSEKMEETVSMVEIALGMFLNSSALSDSQRSAGVLMLCCTYSQIMLNFEPLEYINVRGRRLAPKLDDKLQVMGCLGALVEGIKFKPNAEVNMPPARVLKIRKKFDILLQQYISDYAENTSSFLQNKLISLVECFSLFEFCASNFQSACDTFSRVEGLVKDETSIKLTGCKDENVSNLVLQELYFSHISFIVNAMGINSIPLFHLRTVLDEALQQFPGEFYFHYKFLDIESGSHIAGRLRKFYERNLKRSGHISTTLFAVLSELMRHDHINMAMSNNDVMNSGKS